jgi:hypothetical protein
MPGEEEKDNTHEAEEEDRSACRIQCKRQLDERRGNAREKQGRAKDKETRTEFHRLLQFAYGVKAGENLG